ncbi:unnamed protein product [Anisakis simplex]|uniref:Extensin-like n=1 Tax=Anisakis simplex TaxID=6269 RepID=A0A0M3J4S5_ANISI|nr:unnamed protein product [Anisakis simplex]
MINGPTISESFLKAIVPIKPAPNNNNPPVLNVPFGSPQVPFGSPQVPLGPPLYDDPFPSLPAFKRPKPLPVVSYNYPDEDGDGDNALDNKLCDRINGMLKQLIEPIGVLQWELKSFLGSGTGNAIDSCRKTFTNLDDWGAKCVALKEQSIGAKAAC